jgi:hypothetical protein
MSDTRTDITKLAFNATDKAMAALNEAADRTGLSRTDAANRALQLYAAVLAAEPGQALTFDEPQLGPRVLAVFAADDQEATA